MGMIVGWDNARIEKVKKGVIPKHVTIIYPYYENPYALSKRIHSWGKLPSELRQHLSAIIIDDGSPNYPAKFIVQNSIRPFPIRLFRIETDVRWNWLAARNIGMHYAEGWCAGTDIDHVFPLDTLVSLVWGMHKSNHIYRFQRTEKGKFIHPHPNSWFMTKEMFWEFGGYDEALSGYYGTDGEARRRWAKTAPVLTLAEALEREEYDVDSSTTAYGRKEAIDQKAQELIKARGKDWKPKVLSFPYHEVYIS